MDANSLRCRKIDNQAGRHVSDLAGILGLDYHAVGQREAHLEGIGLVFGDSHLGSTLRKLDPLVGRLLGELDSRIVRADLTGLVLGRDGIRSGRQIFGIGSGVEVHLHDMLVFGILEPDEEVAVATARAVGRNQRQLDGFGCGLGQSGHLQHLRQSGLVIIGTAAHGSQNGILGLGSETLDRNGSSLGSRNGGALGQYLLGIEAVDVLYAYITALLGISGSHGKGQLGYIGLTGSHRNGRLLFGSGGGYGIIIAAGGKCQRRCQSGIKEILKFHIINN